MEVSEDLIRRRNDIRDDRTGVCLIMPVYHAAEVSEAKAEIAAMAETVADLRARYGTLFTQDGHRNGSIAVARRARPSRSLRVAVAQRRPDPGRTSRP